MVDSARIGFEDQDRGRETLRPCYTRQFLGHVTRGNFSCNFLLRDKLQERFLV